MIQFDHPWLLALLALAVLPLLRPPAPESAHAWIALLPRDRVSEIHDWILRALGATALAATVFALAGPYLPEAQVERVSQGAEVVMLLDRSVSMDQPFGTATNQPAFAGRQREPKGLVARQALSAFASRRPDDAFALVVFSTFPLRVLDFTRKQDTIQAAIAAGDVGRGLADTNIGAGLVAALAFFNDRPYNGSRVVLLVSDGGAHLDEGQREAIERLAKRHRVGLYWIYIRSFRSPGLLPDPNNPDERLHDETTLPERTLHKFFGGMGVQYRAYEAEDPEGFQRAMDDLGRAETRPMRLLETVPRRELAPSLLVIALSAVCGLLLARAGGLLVPATGVLARTQAVRSVPLQLRPGTRRPRP